MDASRLREPDRLRIDIACLAALILSGGLANAQQVSSSPALPSPVVQTNGSITFNLVAPTANTVVVSGDYPIGSGNYVSKTRSMTKSAEGIWSVTTESTRNDFYAYRFVIDGVPTLDPQNVAVTRNGSRYLNWAIVPGVVSRNYQINDVPHGNVLHLWYPSPTLQMTRRLTVYTPPGYQASQTRHPVLYLLHGAGGDEDAWSDMGRAPQILDNLIAQGTVVPMIVVMGNGNAWQACAPNDSTEVPKERDTASATMIRYPESIVHDIIPFIDQTFRTRADRDHRAIAGLSMGGAQAAHAAFSYLDQFSWVGLFSPAVVRLPGVFASIPMPSDAADRRGPGLGETIDPVKFVRRYPVIGATLNERLHLLYIGVGLSDGLVESQRDFAKMFDERGVKYTSYDLADYGHDWNYWRLALQDFSTRLFKMAN